MKFAIYGVSRSGKDYFIKALQDYFAKKGKSLYHIKGSDTLNKLALEIYGIKFNECDNKQKIELRNRFILFINEMEKSREYIVVDGHYSFYNAENELYKVCTEFDIKCYDKFFYLDTNPEKILERMKATIDVDKQNHIITSEQIQCWQNFEVDNLTKDLLSFEKELHIIRYDCEFALRYVFDCVIYDKYNSSAIAKDMVKTLKLDSTCVILTDCDKTLSIEDSAMLAFEYIKRDATVLKEIYKNDRYSNFQMLHSYTYINDVKLYTEESVEYVINRISANKRLVDNLCELKRISLVGITAGNGDIWNKVAQKFGLNIFILAHQQMLVSKYVKYFVVKELQSQGKYVIALGDSLLDELMLKQANKGYIITSKGYRNCIENSFSASSTIRQLNYFPLCYSNIGYDETITLKKALEINEYIKTLIDICKSNSNKKGKELRAAHFNLGKEVAKMIQSDLQNDEFVVISIMRSGLPFSFGIADYFDCPVIFFDDKNIMSFECQLNDNCQLENKTFIICDAVVNSGKTINMILNILNGKKCIVATNVLSSKFNMIADAPVYTSRISNHSYIGAKQLAVFEGKGPDTADRLYNLL